MAQDHFARAEKLREVVRGKSDAALRQIEAKIKPHRPAEPGVGIAFRRPGPLDETAEHDAVALGQARFKRTEDTHAQSRLRRPAHDPANERRGEQFDII